MSPADEFTFEHFNVNEIRLRAAVAGSGPLVILVHGFPESWYSWRHQLTALAAAGFKAVAPDVRGYGGSDKPLAIEAYTMLEITRDIVGLIDALGEEQAILVGHDWGAPIVWNTAALNPERIAAVAGLSVPPNRRTPMPPIDLWRKLHEGRFFYQVYFQEEGVAEAELEADVADTLRRTYYLASGDVPPEDLVAFTEKTPDMGFLTAMPNPSFLPDWLTQSDLNYFVSEFESSGFRGPLNRYRAQNLDWEQLPQLAELTIEPPSCFIAGARDPVRAMVPGVDMYADPGAYCQDFRGSLIIDGEGHWIQQEAPQAVNSSLVEFLKTL